MASNLEGIKEELARGAETRKALADAMQSKPDAEEEKRDYDKAENKKLKEINEGLQNTKKGISGLFEKKDDKSFLGILGDNVGMTLGIVGVTYLIDHMDEIDLFFSNFGDLIDGPLTDLKEFVTTFNEEGYQKAFTDLFSTDGPFSELASELKLLGIAIGAIAGLSILDSVFDAVDARKAKKVSSARRTGRGASAVGRRVRSARIRKERARLAEERTKRNAPGSGGLKEAKATKLRKEKVRLAEERTKRNAPGSGGLEEAKAIKVARVSIIDKVKNLSPEQITELERKHNVKITDKGIRRPGGQFVSQAVLNDIGSSASEISKKATRVVTKKVTEKITKSVVSKISGAALKAIPVMGDIAGLGFAAYSTIIGDYTTAGLEVAGAVPIAGVAADIGSIATGVFFDVYGETYTGTGDHNEKMAEIASIVKEQLKRDYEDRREKDEADWARVSAGEFGVYEPEIEPTTAPVISQSLVKPIGNLSSYTSSLTEEKDKIQAYLDKNDLIQKLNENIVLTETEKDRYDELLAEGLFEVFSPSIAIGVIRNQNTVINSIPSRQLIED